MRTLSFLAALAALWLLLSGYFDKPLLLIFGALSVLLVAYVSHRMDLVDDESVPIQLGWSIVTYWGWLLGEIGKSNIEVAKAVILGGPNRIKPKVFTHNTQLKSTLNKVILANSITLTPGTVSVELIGDSITIHALSDRAGDPSTIAEMERRLLKMEGSAT